MATVTGESAPSGEQALAVERHGVEPIGAEERHGRPRSVFTLWWSANVEFATLVTGVLATAAFGLGFGQAVAAIVLGNVVGALLLGWLSARGPALGVPQLVQSRRAFGFYGNGLPALLTFVAGFSWFAVNTVLGVFALEYLLKIGFGGALAIMVVLQIVIAVYGHDLIHVVERYTALALTAVFAAVSVYAFAHAHTAAGFSAKTAGPLGETGAFILTAAIALSYVLGWVPYSSDYTRYLPAATPHRQVFGAAFWAMLLSGVWLEVLGAAIGTLKFVGTPTDLVTSFLPHTLGLVAMLGVILGTVTANVLNIYSGALSGLVLGVRLPRWAATLIVSALGTVLSWVAGRHDFYAHYEVFLFLLSYWIAPWCAVMLVDAIAHRGDHSTGALYRRRPALGLGFAAWLVAIAASVPFMNQPSQGGSIGFVGPFAASHPTYGDLTYAVSFVLAAAVYAGLGQLVGRRERAGFTTSTAA